MTLGALIDLGFPVDFLKQEINKIPLPSWNLEVSRVKRHSLSGIKVDVIVPKDTGVSFSFNEIKILIENSALSQKVKKTSLDIFRRIAEAEAKVHLCRIDEVHFHEIGAVDTLIDIIGTSLGIEYLQIEEIYSSPLPYSRGFIQCEHGTLPCPGPATLELLKGVSLYGIDIDKEIVTPTGAAIISTLSKGFSTMPPLILEKAGYGAGSFEIREIPNLLRIILGSTAGEKQELDKVVVMEANIDDMNPEYFDYLLERLFEEGALDVSISALQMKKNRPGILLRVITLPNKLHPLSEVIFKNSSTSGVRYYEVNRIKLKRKIEHLETPYGLIKVKIFEGSGEETYFHPEYEDLKRIAKENGISLKEAEEFLREIFVKKKSLRDMR